MRIHTQYLLRIFQVFTMEAAGTKHVIVSSYEVFKELLINNADITSSRNPTFRDKDSMEQHKKCPGRIYERKQCWQICP